VVFELGPSDEQADNSGEMSKTKKRLTQQDVSAVGEEIHKLELSAFEEVDTEAFAALSPLKHYLNFSGLTTLSESTAEVFAKHPGILQLDGLTEISDQVATTLAPKKGGLWLNGLKTMSDAAAEALSKHEGDLYLRGLTALSAGAKKALSKPNIFFSRDQVKVSGEK
jgi:hypothetical protein